MNQSLIKLIMCSVVPTIVCGCSEPFIKGGKFSRAEEASLVAINPALTNWAIGASAVWNEGDSSRRVYLDTGPRIGSLGWTHVELLVFRGDGALIEANEFNVPDLKTSSLQIRGVDPLRLTWGEGAVSAAYSAEEGFKLLRRKGRQLQLWSSWKQSGKTNRAELAEAYVELHAWEESGATNWQEFWTRLRDRGVL